jgi:hypothetical protein
VGIRDDLLGLSHWVIDRTNARLEGLTDDEFRWQPVPGSWTVRRLGDGRTVVDNRQVPGADVPPPGIAWRVAHLIEVYGSPRNSRWLRAEVASPPTRISPWEIAFGADESRAILGRAMAHWVEVLEAKSDDELAQKLGPDSGDYADDTLNAFVLHQLDEAIHHGAEVGLLRDLYGSRHRSDDDPTAASLGGQAGAVTRAAEIGRWDLVEALVLDGHPVDEGGLTALHHAVAVGDLAIVRLLVEHGADLDARDPEFGGTPFAWARQMWRVEVADYLRSVHRAGR